MNAFVIAGLTFICTCGAALFGELVSRKLPDEHLDSGSADAIKLVMGLIATMSALVLGLLLAASHGRFTDQSANVQALAADVLVMDRALELFGPEADGVRHDLYNFIEASRQAIWTSDGVHLERLSPLEQNRHTSELTRKVLSLKADTEAKRFAQNQFATTATTVIQTKLKMFEQVQSPLAWPVLVVMIAWVACLFFGLGLLSPFHATVVLAFGVGAACVSAAIYLILELGAPYVGAITVSDEPLRAVLMDIGTPAK